MSLIERCPIWENWVTFQQMGLERRTGRMVGFYGGRHHVALDIQAGAIAGIHVSDRELRIEQVVVRLGLVAPESLRRGLHLEAGRRARGNGSVASYLLRTRLLDRASLTHARERQMVAVLRALLIATDATIRFIDQPVVTPTIETAVGVGDALATAYAEEPLLQARHRRRNEPTVSLLFARSSRIPKPEPKTPDNRQIRTI